VTHCELCPLRRHRRPCPSQWDGCSAACDVAVGAFRQTIIQAAAGPATAEKVAAFRASLATLAGSSPPFGFKGARDGRVRVGIVTPGVYRGGAEVWMHSLIRHTDPAKLDWRGIAVLYPGHIDPTMLDEARGLTRVGFGPEAVDELYASVDVAIVWGVTAWEQRTPPRPRGCRVVLVSHGIGPWTAKVFERASEADAFAAVAKAALNPMPVDVRSAAVVIPNCYEPGRVVAEAGAREHLRDEWGVEPGETVVGYLGRMSDEKNPLAAVALADSNPSVRVVFVGGGLGEKGVRAAVASEPEDVQRRVVFAGPVSHPGDVLAAFDALLLPSHEEACSLTLLEAWAAGVPVLATPVGIVPEHPGLVRALPMRPTGGQIAQALAADRADPDGTCARVARAKATAEASFAPGAFGAAWTELIAAEGAKAQSTAKVVRRVVTAPPAASELEVLGVVAKCPHAKVCSCKSRGLVACQPGGRRPGQKVHPSVCQGCLAETKHADVQPQQETPMPIDLPASLGRDVFVSNVGHCGALGHGYDLRIHLYRNSQTDNERCPAVAAGDDHGLVIHYSEGEGLGRMSVPLADVVAFARRPGRLLVHCQYGMYRAPMLGMVALVARGATPAEAIAACLEAQWRDRGVAFFMADQPMSDLLRWWEANRGEAAA
jgi:glycosyltransferase involved in cell wall biosynthesis